jgi:hypothetical protein
VAAHLERGRVEVDGLMNRMVAAGSEAAACSGAGNDTAVCSRAKIDDGQWRRRNGFSGDSKARERVRGLKC